MSGMIAARWAHRGPLRYDSSPGYSSPLSSTAFLCMLSDAQRKYLRRLGHDRNPVVLIGNPGLSPNLIAEMDRALTDHELVKVRARVGDRDAARRRSSPQLATATALGAGPADRPCRPVLPAPPDEPGIMLPD